jgi:hypothetical protein
MSYLSSIINYIVVEDVHIQNYSTIPKAKHVNHVQTNNHTIINYQINVNSVLNKDLFLMAYHASNEDLNKGAINIKLT